MSTGAQMLGVMTFVLICDVFIARYVRGLADRIEGGETVASAGTANPIQLRKAATLLVWGMLPLWIVVVLISFGAIPTGIDTIKF